MRFPVQGWIGVALVAIAWPLDWALDGLRTQWLFTPLWVGYVLTVDGICVLRRGTSIWTRSRSLFAQLFAVSIPSWWLFETINARLANWEYLARDRFGSVEYAVLCTISFSTVVPAVFETAELVRGTRFVERFARGPKLRPSHRKHSLYLAVGVAMLGAMLARPRNFYPFEWTAIVFLLEPLAARVGRRSFSDDLSRGDWRTWFALWLGGLVCGVFWEMWNFWSYPKWIYHTPGVEFAKVFEMPLLGYLGYLPFAMELWLVAQICLPKARDLRI